MAEAFVNKVRPKATRRAIYAILRLAGLTPSQARSLRDYHIRELERRLPFYGCAMSFLINDKGGARKRKATKG